MALLNLVDGTPEVSVDLLESARTAPGSSPQILSDLAAAHWEAAARAGDRLHLLASLEASSTALQRDPGSADALFNQTLALASLGLLRQAKITARRLEASAEPSGWRAEARSIAQGPAVSITADQLDKELQQFLVDEFRDVGLFAQGVEDPRFISLSAQLNQDSEDSFYSEVQQHLASLPPEHREVAAVAMVQLSRGLESYANLECSTAEPELARASKQLHQLENPLGQLADLHLAVCAYRRGDRDEADSQLQELSASLASENYRLLDGKTDWMLGLVASAEGRHQDSEVYYQRAVEAMEHVGAVPTAGFLKSLLSSLALRTGRRDVSWRWTSQALIDTIGSTSIRHAKTVYENAATTADSLGYSIAAQFFSDEAVEVALESELPSVAAEALYERAERRLAAGRVAEAKADLSSARVWLARIEEPDIRRITTAGILTVEGLAPGSLNLPPQETHDALSGAIDSLEADGTAALLPGLYRARGSVRRLIGDHEGAVSDLRKAVAEAESQRRQLDDLITRSRFSAIVRGSLEDLLALELEESREAGSVLPLTDHLRDASFFSSVDWDTEGTIEGRRVTDFPLPDRAAILSFSVLDDRVVSWIVARGELRVHQESIKRERLEELVRRAVDRPLSETRETRTELFELLLGGYREQLDAVDHLAIAPDRLIAETPFPVLFDRDSGTHLVESHSTSFTPSALATLLSTLDPPDSDPHPMAIHEPGAVVLIGFPGSHDEPLYPYLEGVPREIAALLQIYPNALVFGSGSSKQEILEAMQHAQIIHFAGHVAPFPGVPELSSLVLAGTSGIDFITAGEIRRLQLQAEIVVFAGCKSGVAPEKGQASQPSLAHAAMRAGSRAVVASAIPLEDSVTAAISATLHRDVHQGIHIHLAVKRLHGVRLLSMNPNGDSWKSIMTHSRSVRGDSDERR